MEFSLFHGTGAVFTLDQRASAHFVRLLDIVSQPMRHDCDSEALNIFRSFMSRRASAPEPDACSTPGRARTTRCCDVAAASSKSCVIEQRCGVHLSCAMNFRQCWGTEHRLQFLKHLGDHADMARSPRSGALFDPHQKAIELRFRRRKADLMLRMCCVKKRAALRHAIDWSWCSSIASAARFAFWQSRDLPRRSATCEKSGPR